MNLVLNFKEVNWEPRDLFFVDLTSFSMVITGRNGIFMHNFSYKLQVINFKNQQYFAADALKIIYAFRFVLSRMMARELRGLNYFFWGEGGLFGKLLRRLDEN